MNTRKRISLLTAFTLAVTAASLLRAQPAGREDRDLYVDAAAPENGDGSRHHPFWRITDAVVRARAIRDEDRNDEEQRPEDKDDRERKIVIHVRAGIYVGSYTITGPRTETLPILLDVSRLTILGSTLMERDESGLPTGVIEPQSNTLLRAEPPLSGPQALVVIAPTGDDVVVERVTIARLSLNADAGTSIAMNGAQGFDVRDNYMTGALAGFAVVTDRSSGHVIGNYVTRTGCGICVGAGSGDTPANVRISGNRSVGNQDGGVLLNGSTDPTSPGGDTLAAVVSGNDLSENTSSNPLQGFGLRILAITIPTTDNRPTSGSVTATIFNNRIAHNNYGVVMDAGFAHRTLHSISDPRLYTGTFDLAFEHNVIGGNVRTPALITFTRSTAALNPVQLNPDCPGNATIGCFKYLERSLFDIRDATGELDGYWFDHPEIEPIDGRTLTNVLRINGNVIPNGRFIPNP